MIESITAAVGRHQGSVPDTLDPIAPSATLAVYGCEGEEAALFEAIAPRLGVRATLTEAPLSEDDLALAAGARCVSVAHRSRVSNAALLALSRAGVERVITRSVGCDHIDLAYAASVGISVATVSYSPDSVADYTLMLMLMALRHARSMVGRLDVGDWATPVARGREMRDLTVGVVGAGRIGSAVIERLRGFGPAVLTHDRCGDRSPRSTPLDELLRRSDVVTLHVPLSADTHHLLDRRRIRLMRPGALVVNTGRGALLDTGALVEALESGRLGGAALDVLEGEEGIFHAARGSEVAANQLLARLAALPNALVSPHIAYFTDRALRDIVEGALLDCLDFEGGRER